MSRPNPHEVQNIRRLRSHLGECTVLLKKDGSFPLEKAGTIAAYGSGVRRTIKGGTGSGEVNSRYFINVERGLERAGFTIVSTDWLDAYDRIREDNKKAFYRGIREKAKKNGTSVIAAGMGAVMLEPEYELPRPSTCSPAAPAKGTTAWTRKAITASPTRRFGTSSF